MSIITKESIADTIEGLEQLVNRGIQSVHIDMAISGMRRLLASLEAEAVGEVVLGEYDDCGCHPDARVACIAADGQADWENFKDGTRLYTAPPAPVSVPDAMDDQGGVCCEVSYADGWNACRAAMLQGADGNSLVNQDGWVACSERMPDKLIPVMVMYADGEMWSAIWTGKKWDDGTEFPDPHAVTHWQEMPAAPQQEVK